MCLSVYRAGCIHKIGNRYLCCYQTMEKAANKKSSSSCGEMNDRRNERPHIHFFSCEFLLFSFFVGIWMCAHSIINSIHKGKMKTVKQVYGMLYSVVISLHWIVTHPKKQNYQTATLLSAYNLCAMILLLQIMLHTVHNILSILIHDSRHSAGDHEATKKKNNTLNISFLYVKKLFFSSFPFLSLFNFIQNFIMRSFNVNQHFTIHTNGMYTRH